jgi:hypothetical protein
MKSRNESAWWPRRRDNLARALIQEAACNAPSPLSGRLEEEWLADLREQRGTASRLRFAIGCYWASRVIAHEYLAPSLAAAERGTATGFARYDSSFFSSRMRAILLTVGGHVAVFSALASRWQRTPKLHPSPMEIQFVQVQTALVWVFVLVGAYVIAEVVLRVRSSARRGQ